MILVDLVLTGNDIDYDADLNGDGTINVLDIVFLLNLIINTSNRIADASHATLMILDHSLSLSANGYIGGVQMTLKHAEDVEIDLTDNALVADYYTTGNTTKLIVIEPADNLLFTISQSYEIVDMMVVNSTEVIDVDISSEFELSHAYPNPFNPSTTISLTVPISSHVSIKVYNLMGQVVDVLADQLMEANVYNFTWNASDMPSGVYLIKAESLSGYDVQKVLLVK